MQGKHAVAFPLHPSSSGRWTTWWSAKVMPMKSSVVSRLSPPIWPGATLAWSVDFRVPKVLAMMQWPWFSGCCALERYKEMNQKQLMTQLEKTNKAAKSVEFVHVMVMMMMMMMMLLLLLWWWWWWSSSSSSSWWWWWWWSLSLWAAGAAGAAAVAQSLVKFMIFLTLGAGEVWARE